MNQMKVVITGSEGSVGKILSDGLSEIYDLSLIDKISSQQKNFLKINVGKDYAQLCKALIGKDAVIHLAWDNGEDFPKENIEPLNKKMAENVFKASVKAGVKKIIFSSSVHVNDYTKASRQQPIKPGQELVPDSPYGATKIYIEHLGKYYAKRYGLKVVCVRLGGLNEDDKARFNEDPHYDKVLLKKKDAILLIKKILDKPNCPDFSAFYAVSPSGISVHDTANPFGWKQNDKN
jgi:uronate dehydrogenase